MVPSIIGGTLHPASPYFDGPFCQFPIGDIDCSMKDDPNLFCGLVGNKSTGKSTALEHIASEQMNCSIAQLMAIEALI